MTSRGDKGPGDPEGKHTRITWRRSFQFQKAEPIYPPVEAPIARRATNEDEAIQAAEETLGQELQGVYIISVAARILQMHPQTLRKYERIGLVTPSRTLGMLRLYSQEDITKLRTIKHLVENLRLNLAGVEMALSLVSRLLSLRQRLDQETEESLRDTLDQELEELLELLKARFP